MKNPIKKISTWLKKGLLLPALLFSLGLSAQQPEIKVQLRGGEMTYQEIFMQIETQCEVWFGYITEDMNVNQTISVPAGAMTLDVLLKKMFDGTPYKYFFSDQHILITRRNAPMPVGETSVTSSAPEAYNTPQLIYTPYEARLPSIAVKSNLLYDLTTTVNLGIEIGLSGHWTLDVPFNYNPWKFGETRIRHFGVQPEGRYWFCERFNGWFMGIHAHYAKFNVGGLPDWLPVSENMQQNRYQGHLYGGGISAGYAWILKKRWSMEASLGVGYARIDADKYPCAHCGTGEDKGGKNYFGPTKVSLSLIYTIK